MFNSFCAFSATFLINVTFDDFEKDSYSPKTELRSLMMNINTNSPKSLVIVLIRDFIAATNEDGRSDDENDAAQNMVEKVT